MGIGLSCRGGRGVVVRGKGGGWEGRGFEAPRERVGKVSVTILGGWGKVHSWTRRRGW